MSWELSAANCFFSVYQKHICCVRALVTASLYSGSLQYTFVGLQSSVCQQGWPSGNESAMNNWLKGRVYTWAVQLPKCYHYSIWKSFELMVDHILKVELFWVMQLEYWRRRSQNPTLIKTRSGFVGVTLWVKIVLQWKATVQPFTPSEDMPQSQTLAMCEACVSACFCQPALQDWTD